MTSDILSSSSNIRNPRKRHGMHKSSEYSAWEGIIDRCLNKNNKVYKSYGGRGISVCDEWLDFVNFYNDMGPKPGKLYSIDRIDNDGNYEPNNCRWATKKEQARNTRSNRILKSRGASKCISEWVEGLDISRSALMNRLNNGWSADAALTTPKQSREVLITAMGKTLNIRQWAEELNIIQQTFYKRLSMGWSIEKIASTPVREPEKLLTLDGKTLSIAGWSQEINMPQSTLKNRLRRGWSVEKALTAPIKRKSK